jgi:MoxR-like ATPase
MRVFWGRGAEQAGHAQQRHPVRDALIAAIDRGEAGAPFDGTVGPWRRREGDPGTDDEAVLDHPAGYIAVHEPQKMEDGSEDKGDNLVHAINAALLLGKPLLLTGNPGTGKSQLAERIAWEFNLGPVLRFESQSLSEAGDLFYRFDLVGRLAGIEGYKAALSLQRDADPLDAGVERHLSFGPLGRAILRALPQEIERLLAAGLRPESLDRQAGARPSVVLIDEIDKTSRDFPNDLLNAIERKEFRIRELGDRLLRTDDEALQPIVLITSNSERELPAPFLRRCIYYHIPDPREARLARILRSRVQGSGDGQDMTRLHPLYADVLSLFTSYRESGQNLLAYRPGTSELLDLARTLDRARQRDLARGSDSDIDPFRPLSTPGNFEALRRAAGTLLKHREDRSVLEDALNKWKPQPR